jgi:transposase
LEFLHPSPVKYIGYEAKLHGLNINLSSSSISKLFSSIDEGEVHAFFRHIASSSSTIVFDITSLSYYGSSLNYAEYGYNRDNQYLPQVNLCLSVDIERNMPVYFRILNGSIPDVSTVITTMNELKSLGYSDSHFVFDRGFYSKINLEEMASYKYTGALPKSTKIFEELIRHNLDIEHLGNVVEYRNEHIMVREVVIDGIKYIIVYSPKLRYEQSDTFMVRLLETERLLQRYCNKYSSDKLQEMAGSYWRYFEVKGCNIIRRKKAIQRAVNLMGKYVLLTNDIESSWREVLDRYREKDIVEKAFEVLKNHGFLTPLRVWSDKTLYGKIFAAFIFYCIYRRIMGVVDMPYNEVIRILDTMQTVVYEDGNTVDMELTKKQKKLLKKLGM